MCLEGFDPIYNVVVSSIYRVVATNMYYDVFRSLFNQGFNKIVDVANISSRKGSDFNVIFFTHPLFLYIIE